jgi:hypothetical protein
MLAVKALPRGRQHATGLASSSVIFPSKTLLKMLEDIGRAGIWAYDFDSGGLFWSEGMYRLLGFAPNSVEPGLDSVKTLVEPSHLEALEKSFLNVVTGNIKQIRGPIRLPNGTRRWIASQSELIYAAESGTKRVIGVALDVSEQQLALDELGRRDAVRGHLGRDLGLFFLERNWQLSKIDHADWKAFTGTSSEQLQKHGWRGCVDANDIERLSAEIDIAQHRNQSLMTGFRWRDANATIRAAHLGLINIQQKSGADMDRVGLLLLLPMALTTSIEAGEITGNLIRAARVLIDWSVENLAEASGVSIATISRLERGNYGKGRNSSHDAVMRALERGGIAFERNYQGVPGISLRLTTAS